jgi:hypothetical protein
MVVISRLLAVLERVQHRRRAKGPTVEESFLKTRIGDAGPGTQVSGFPTIRSSEIVYARRDFLQPDSGPE